MKITYKNPGFDHSIGSILLFQTDDQTPFWSDPLLHFFPQIDKNELVRRTGDSKKAYLRAVFQDVYRETEDELNRKAISYNAHFDRHRAQINDALSDAFAVDAGSLFNDLTGNITLNPICPRFLQERCFDIFYKNSERGALGLSIHEVIHYFWFHVWNRHFSDSYSEYETPSMKWILSEMVVEAIMSDPRLSSINPYFPKENGGCVYPYFQDMIIDGVPVLKTLDDFYRSNSITDFMELSYAYCLRHEHTIRQHIAEEEANF